MKLFFFESGSAMFVSVANGKVFDTEDDFYNAYPDRKIEISAVGYHDKSFCKDEIFEVWDITGDKTFLGKVVKISNLDKFVSSLSKWSEKYNTRPEYAGIKEIINTLSVNIKEE
jgi:hypothetical protein